MEISHCQAGRTELDAKPASLAQRLMLIVILPMDTQSRSQQT
jgi:hypothetical protein